ncbi:NACHT domain-containing protein [Modestobacter roseus]|uniref:NACHT domain-containing protein n=1 Tax=Modestobacter roseus TaxID=1181884 RepID=UPI001295C397|nr:NACHT domain-containing protein [Modestobacter roseus]MQA36075.1 NACHT domain-containing protein [Modestobacter roseus]
MDKTELVAKVSALMQLAQHDVRTSVVINHREIDVVATELTGLSRKTILIECADYAAPVGVPKLQDDLQKLKAAREVMGNKCVIMHMSMHGYSSQAHGYALEHGIEALTLAQLTSRVMNLDAYVAFVDDDAQRQTILREYQPTKLHVEGDKNSATAALDFLQDWLQGDENWLTVLGDYGVGKSWMLKRLLYTLIDSYKQDPTSNPLPIYVPLQLFTKSFDLTSLITLTLQSAGVSIINTEAIEYLSTQGRIVYLFDSFDEMAQVMNANVVRDNMAALLTAVSGGSRAIMTSRPNYFESRAERLVVVERGGVRSWAPLDDVEYARRSSVAQLISDRLEQSSFARLNDLSPAQRDALFERVLADQPEGLMRLKNLFRRFQGVESVSQRAVIARLLTTIAETLGPDGEVIAPDGSHEGPRSAGVLNEAGIFRLVIYNLLQRDQQSGGLSAGERYAFLRHFSLLLQQGDRSFFATPAEIRALVAELFGQAASSSDTPQAVLENYYRACRRHSGLTTEGQFYDTSGNVDAPVDERDYDSPVGFSHNSLREYLIADSCVDWLINGVEYPRLFTAALTAAAGSFLVGLAQDEPQLPQRLKQAFLDYDAGPRREWLFRAVYAFIRESPANGLGLLGSPARLANLDLSLADLSSLALVNADFTDSLLLETDLRKSDLRGASFDSAILQQVMLDAESVRGADFTAADVISINVFDAYTTNTFGILAGKAALQWLFSSGAKVANSSDLNQYLGQPWYEAAREVARTLVSRMAGTHQDDGLVRGTKHAYRTFATDFRDYLIRRGILEEVKKDRAGNRALRVAASARASITSFAENGAIDDSLMPFFEPHLKRSE